MVWRDSRPLWSPFSVYRVWRCPSPVPVVPLQGDDKCSSGTRWIAPQFLETGSPWPSDLLFLQRVCNVQLLILWKGQICLRLCATWISSRARSLKSLKGWHYDIGHRVCITGLGQKANKRQLQANSQLTGVKGPKRAESAVQPDPDARSTLIQIKSRWIDVLLSCTSAWCGTLVNPCKLYTNLCAMGSARLLRIPGSLWRLWPYH